MEKQFHEYNHAKRRGGTLPGRLRVATRRGVTLVELLIAMLILTIVCIAWLEIIGAQSARREARRREAVERLAGMLDAFLYCYKGTSFSLGDYEMISTNRAEVIFLSRGTTNNVVFSMFDRDVTSLGYRISVVDREKMSGAVWFQGWDVSSSSTRGSSARPPKWLVGTLYNQSGKLTDVGKPFFTLPVCLGI